VNEKPVKAGHVRVTVRARGVVPFGWAGRMWPTEPEVHDASPNEVLDLLKAPPQSLHVVWPEAYVAPDGTMPGRVSITAPKAEAPVLSPAERLQHAEHDATRARAAAMATEREFGDYRRQMVGEQALMRAEVANAKDSAAEAERRAAAADARAEAAVGHAEDIERGHADVITKIREGHAGELDTLRAQHAAELAQLVAEHDRTVAMLTAELDKATAPKRKVPPSGSGTAAQPAAPTPPSAPTPPATT